MDPGAQGPVRLGRVPVGRQERSKGRLEWNTSEGCAGQWAFSAQIKPEVTGSSHQPSLT